MKRTHLIFVLMLAALTAQAVLYEIYYDPGSTPEPNRITGYKDRFVNESEPAPINAIRGQTGDHVQGVGFVQTEPLWHLYVSAIGNGSDGQISQLTAQQRQDILDALAAERQAALIESAKTALAASEAEQYRLTRALGLVMLDEINLLRAAASLSQRTPSQLKAAVEAKLDADGGFE